LSKLSKTIAENLSDLSIKEEDVREQLKVFVKGMT